MRKRIIVLLQDREPISSKYWRVVYGGRLLTDDKPLRDYGIETDSTLHLVGQLLGGKGGFGSLLRGAGRAILTDNVDACRDLSGRRLRQANAEKRLAEWAAEARERELEKVALKHVKEQQKATQKEARAQVCCCMAGAQNIQSYHSRPAVITRMQFRAADSQVKLKCRAAFTAFTALVLS